MYQYSPIDLEGPSIRLLRVLKGTELNVNCQLFEAWLDVEDLIDYEALSYTWGSTELSASVNIDGQALNVTESLYLALQYLRSDKLDRILWVDAICIDQGNYHERGHQVQQMGSVYSRAYRVIIWLGPATDDTQVLLDSLKRMEQASNNLACREWTLADYRWQDLWSSLQPELKSSHWNLAARQSAGLHSLLRQPWFKRVWILQEAANAKRAIVCSGTRSVSTRIFILAPLLLRIKPEPHCQAVLDIMPGSSRKESWWAQKRDLYTLLLKFSESQASDPRDMLYALLGMCSDFQEASSIPVDYTKEPQQVVKDAASFLFDATNCSYDTIPELMRNASSLNADYLIKEVNSCNLYRIGTFLRLRGGEVVVTEEVVKAAVAEKRSGKEIMKLLLDQRANEVVVTEEVIKAAAANTGSAEDVMRLLLDQRASEVVVTEEVVKAAAANIQSGEEVMQLLLDKRPNEVVVTEDVVTAAAANTQRGKKLLRLLLNQRASEVVVTEEAVKAAAANTYRGG